MSYTETHFGKLRKVKYVDTVEEWFKQKCLEKGITELPKHTDTWREAFLDLDKNYKKYFVAENDICEAIDHIEAEESDIDVMIPNEDGTITFIQQFYNGGTCLSECIEDGIKRLKKEFKIS